MTVIATDGRTMACDGIVTQHGTIIDLDCCKVDRLSDGSVFGSAGDSVGGDLMRDWLNGGKVGDFPRMESTTGLLLNVDGTVDLYCSEDGGRPTRVPPPMAIGSGMDIAIGAMDAGASPQRAVEITIRRVPNTGGTVRSQSIGEMRRTEADEEGLASPRA